MCNNIHDVATRLVGLDLHEQQNYWNNLGRAPTVFLRKTNNIHFAWLENGYLYHIGKAKSFYKICIML